MHRQLDTKAELELLNKILHSNGIYSAETQQQQRQHDLMFSMHIV